MATPPFRLAMDVFTCLSGNHLVILDLRRNQYLCMGRHSTQVAMHAFGGLVEPGAGRFGSPAGSKSGEASRIYRALVERGLLVQAGDDATTGMPRSSIQAPGKALSTRRSDPHHVIRTRHWGRFAVASLKATAKLRFCSMHTTVKSVANRKRGYSGTVSGDVTELYQLAYVFRQLRPYYPRKHVCLFDSLALIEFLAARRHYPTWVFGVRTDPFGAHCWVQANELVVNDTLENVHTYTPIMAV